MSTSTPPLLEIQNLRVEHRSPGRCAVAALAGVDLTLRAGEVVGLLGESGCGKTTLALAVAGLLAPTARRSGSIWLEGRALDALSERERERLRGAAIGIVYQEPALSLHPLKRVLAQVAEVLHAHGGGRWRRCREDARARLAEVGLDDPELARAFPHQLSGGQRQRVALAQALACRPRLVIADEPTAALDAPNEQRVLELALDLHRRLGVAFLWISHDPDTLARLGGRWAVMDAGTVVETGPFQELLASPHHPKSRELLAARPARSPVLPSASPEPLLVAHRLSKTFFRGSPLLGRRRPVVALADVGFEIGRGRIVGLAGASGSGKSTLARCLALLERPDTGALALGGRDLLALAGRELRTARRRIQLVHQDPATALSPRFSALEAVAEPLRLAGWKAPAARSRALELMTEVGLGAELAGQRALALSGGQKRRLVLARALAAEPEVLILDEGLAGLDRPLQNQLAELLLELRARRGLGLVLIAHDLRLLATLADEIAVLDTGRLVERAPSAELLAAPRHPTTRALVAALPPSCRP